MGDAMISFLIDNIYIGWLHMDMKSLPSWQQDKASFEKILKVGFC